MKTVRAAEVNDAIPGDVVVLGIRWVNDEKDVLIELAYPGTSQQSPPHGTLRCTWATDVRIDIDLSGRVGTVPAGEHSVCELDDGRWRVSFDRRPGLISLLCNEVTLTSSEVSNAG